MLGKYFEIFFKNILLHKNILSCKFFLFSKCLNCKEGYNV